MSCGIVESLILLPNPYKDKYATIQKVIEYCIQEFDVYDEVKLKNILSILNVIWSTYPTLHEKWGEQLIEKSTRMKYQAYLK